MKKFLSWILIFVLCLTMVACASSGKTQPAAVDHTAQNTAPAATEQEGTGSTAPVEYPEGPILYKVTDSEGHVAWLFGSIHVGREDYYPLPDYVMNAYRGADALAVEANVVAFEADQAAATQFLMGMMYKDGTTIKDHIPAELYTRCVSIFQAENIYMPTLDMFSSYIWYSMIQELAMEKLSGDIQLGIDRYFLTDADTTGKPILEVESVEFQYDMFGNFPDAVMSMMLESAVKMYDDPEGANAEMVEMMDLWASGDEQAFVDYLASEDDDMTPEEQKLYAEYNQVIVVDRNLSMADWAENALSSGDEVFIVVGAAHVIGEGALADLLTQRGYTVERIAG